MPWYGVGKFLQKKKKNRKERKVSRRRRYVITMQGGGGGGGETKRLVFIELYSSWRLVYLLEVWRASGCSFFHRWGEGREARVPFQLDEHRRMKRARNDRT